MLILLKYFLVTSNIFQVSSAGEYTCKCRHNTCGELCDSCCPMYNQRRWTTGKFISGNECERCQCYGEYCIFNVHQIFFFKHQKYFPGHADECYFDPQVESERRSQNTAGKLSGGGVCIK